MAHGEDGIEVVVLVVRQETEKAVQIVTADDRMLYWIPKSQIGELEPPLKAGDRNRVIRIPEWLALAKGLM